MSGSPKSRPPEGLIDTTLEALETAWLERREEAETLEQAGFLSTAAALRLYSLEILVKVVICKHLGLTQLPASCKTHDLGLLIIHTGRWGDVYGADKEISKLRGNWDFLVNCSKTRLNDLRYQPRAEWDSVYDASVKGALYGSANDAQDGVVTWLSQDI